MIRNLFFTAFLACSFFAINCSAQTGTPTEGAGERAGKNVDQAIDAAKEGLKKAVAATGRGLEQVGEKLQAAVTPHPQATATPTAAVKD
jgi:hypothetical protein